MDQEYSLGEWIRKRRKALGLTQEELSGQVGYSAAMLRKIENDERRPSERAAALLAEALEIPLDQRDNFLKVARQAQAVFRLGPSDREVSFPWQTPSPAQTNLPLPATLFVGREVELVKLGELLQDPTCRLLTIVGLPGIGKTRLAVQAARTQMDRFAHGVFFIPLASLTAPEMIVATIANVIDFRFYGAADPEQQMLRYLQNKHMLLVLDNFEHLLEGAGLLSAILQVAPGIQFLVTSRERLNLQGEWVYEVGGLPYPETVDEKIVARIQTYGAVQLFLQSALRVNPSFRLDEENVIWVARICQLLEGMPLGLELAAAWVRVISCQAIAREIESNLGFLRASAQDLPDRHRSLRAALEHSWKLLSENEKEIFSRLSVFRGGFQREAAEVVARASLEEITSLLDKSLLRRVGEERYDLHEIIRQFGAAILSSDQQKYAETRDRHSSYYAALLEQWTGHYRSPKQLGILERMDVEIDNVRLAWSWMAARQQTVNIQKSLSSLWHFHEIRGQLREGAALFGEAADALEKTANTETDWDAERQVVLGHVLAHQGYFVAHLDQYEEADKLLRRSLALLRSNKDRNALAEALAYRGHLKYRQGEFTQAIQDTQESLKLNQALGDQIGIVFCLIILSYIHNAQGAYEQAYKLSSESLEICRDILGDPHGMADCMLTLSAAAKHLGQFGNAKGWARQSLRISKALNDRWGIAQTLRLLGLINLKLGETRRAEILARQCVAQSREIGDRTLMATALICLGMVTSTSGAYSESRGYFQEALQMALETKSIVVALQAMVEFASIEMREGAHELALDLVIRCLQSPMCHLETIEHAERLRTELEARLTPDKIATVTARARTKTLEGLAEEILPMIHSTANIWS